MNSYLTSFYHAEDGIKSVQLGIFQSINSDDAEVNHLRFFCRKQADSDFVKQTLRVYELTEDTAYVLLVEQAAGILDDDFIATLAKKYTKFNVGFEYYLDDNYENT